MRHCGRSDNRVSGATAGAIGSRGAFVVCRRLTQEFTNVTDSVNASDRADAYRVRPVPGTGVWHVAIESLPA